MDNNESERETLGRIAHDAWQTFEYDKLGSQAKKEYERIGEAVAKYVCEQHSCPFTQEQRFALMEQISHLTAERNAVRDELELLRTKCLSPYPQRLPNGIWRRCQRAPGHYEPHRADGISWERCDSCEDCEQDVKDEEACHD